MKRITQLFVVIFLFLYNSVINAQVETYAFSHNIGTYTANAATATNLAAVEADGGISTVQNIGFNFTYAGNNYTQFFMSSNGFISLGPTGSTVTANNLSAANVSQRPIIAPLWDDLDGRAGGAGAGISKASFEVTGTAPNRVLTVEWLNWEWNYNSADPVISFQVKLYETTNVIEFVYRQEPDAVNNASASIGINNPLGTGFLNLNTDLATPTVTSTTAVNTIVTKPANNQVFRFTPPTCLYTGLMTTSAITQSSATITLSTPFTVPIQVFVGTTAPTATSTPNATIPAGTTSVNVTGLAVGVEQTIYFRYTCTGSTTATPWMNAGSFFTLCGIVDNFYENFESVATGSSTNPTKPQCFSYIDTAPTAASAYGYVSTTASYNTTGARGYYTYRSATVNAGNTGDLMLVSPETNNLGSGTKRVRFMARKSTEAPNPVFEIYRLNGNTATATKTLIQEITVTTEWTEYIVYLPNTTDDYFAFSFDRVGTSSPYVYLDDIYYEDAPTCIPVTNVQISDIDKNTAKVTWEDLLNIPGITYKVEVRTTGNPGTAGAVFTANTAAGVMQANITGLNPAIQYKVYVSAVCGANNLSAWSDAVQFFTLCDYPNFVSHTQSLTYCGPHKASLEAVASGTNTTIGWYDTANSYTPLHLGNNYTTADYLTNSRSYFVRTAANYAEVNNIQIGTGTLTASTQGTFLYHSWGGYKHQYIILASELTAAGFTGGVLNSIAFDIITAGDSRKEFSISLGTTTASTATTTFIPNDNLTQVYYSSNQSFSSNSWNTIEFQNGYFWDGVSNLVVQTNWSNNNSSGVTGTMRYHTVSTRTTYAQADNVLAQVLLDRATGTTITGRPNMRFNGFTGCLSPSVEIPVTINPSTDIVLMNDYVITCEGEASSLITLNSGASAYDTFTWEPATGVTGNAAAGWHITASEDTKYTLVATNSTTDCKAIDQLDVFISKKPGFNELNTSYEICKNIPLELSLVNVLPDSLTIGDANTASALTSTQSAFVNSAKFSKQQFIYRATELAALGLNSKGFIKGLAFEINSAGASTYNNNYTIRMKSVANTTFANTDFEEDGFTTVYKANTHTHSNGGWQNIMFMNQFYYDGLSNIIVEITQEGLGAGSNAPTLYTAVTGTLNQVALNGTSNTDADITSGSLNNNRFNTLFLLETPKVTWSPATNLFTDSATTIPYQAGQDFGTVYVKSSTGGIVNYTATVLGLNTCASLKTIEVKTTDVGLPLIQAQTFCSAVNVQDIVLTTVPNATAVYYTTATDVNPITTISQSGTYYVEAELNGCKSPRVAFTVTIANLAAPTVQATQVICDSGMISNLIATGAGNATFKWYATATSTVVLDMNTVVTDGTTYYVSQSVGTCESTRVPVLVDVNPIPAALATQSIFTCGSTTFGALNLNQTSGATLVWYESATATTAIPNTQQVVTGVFYVSQKVNGCESGRVQISINAQGAVPAPTSGIQNICGGGIVADLTPTILPNATALWYSTANSNAPLAAATVLVNGTYYLAQQIGDCISVKVPVTVRVISTTAPAVAPFILCEGSTVENLAIPAGTGVSYVWYATATSTTALLPTQVLTNGYYFVSRSQFGCESVRTMVQVTINSRPASPTGVATQNFLDYAEISDIIMNQPNVVWYLTEADALSGTNPLPQNMPMIDGSTYYGVIIGTNGCASNPFAVTIVITLGVNDLDLTKLKYYPNPVNDILSIEYQDAIKKVEIFDLTGKLVKTEMFDGANVQLNLSNLSSGTYMVSIHTEKQSQFVKVIKK